MADPLTAREREVLRLIAMGESNKSISASLGIQIGTVEAACVKYLREDRRRGRADATSRAVALGRLPLSGGITVFLRMCLQVSVDGIRCSRS
jgi:DNA-binding NarL/FixJ family response regulator